MRGRKLAAKRREKGGHGVVEWWSGGVDAGALFFSKGMESKGMTEFRL